MDSPAESALLFELDRAIEDFHKLRDQLRGNPAENPPANPLTEQEQSQELAPVEATA